MIHNKAVMLMAKLTVERVITTPLLPHIEKQIVGQAVIHICADSEDRALGSIAPDIVTSVFGHTAEIKAIRLLHTPFGAVSATSLTLEYHFICNGIAYFKRTFSLIQ
jgi:hypothetical protein